MSDRAKRRESALAMWRLIQIELHRGRDVPRTAHDYLREVCDRILGPVGNGDANRVPPVHADPLMLKRPAGNQAEPEYTRTVARAVHKRLTESEQPNESETLNNAAQAVAHALSIGGWEHGGAVEAAYQNHRAEIEAADAFYAERRVGFVGPLRPGTVEAILAGPKKRKKPGSQSG